MRLWQQHVCEAVLALLIPRASTFTALAAGVAAAALCLAIGAALKPFAKDERDKINGLLPARLFAYEWGVALRIKQRLKQRLRASPALWGTSWRIKQELLRLWLLRYMVHDLVSIYRSMFWAPGSRARHTLCAALLFQYHKLEKGLSMPGPRHLSGIDRAAEVMRTLRLWQAAGHADDDPIFLRRDRHPGQFCTPLGVSSARPARTDIACGNKLPAGKATVGER